MRRRIALAVAAICGVAALLLAVLPFTGRVSSREGQTMLGGAGLEGARGFEGDCGPPVISSWHDGSGAWSVEQNRKRNDGYADLGSLGPWCEDSARARLLSSLGLGVLGIGAVVAGRRMRPGVVIPAPS